ncbi:hypothetical protein ACIGO9_30880 [Nocardia asteroides]|uniref:hypothetical protein n=1 Tax=Nocardia asteroides TaxID=1824 RepID=UPI0037C6A3D0
MSHQLIAAVIGGAFTTMMIVMLGVAHFGHPARHLARHERKPHRASAPVAGALLIDAL